MPYQWIRYLHILSAVGFVAIHGASIVVLYAIRGEKARPRIDAILDFSGRTANAMYVSLVAVVGTGFWMGFTQSSLLREYWYWWSVGLLVATGVLMWFVAKPFSARLRAATEIRPSGVPRVSDGELGQILRSSRPHVIAAIGVAGLAAIIFMMVFQPAIIGDGTFGGDGGTTITTPDSQPVSDAELLAIGEDLFQQSAGGVGCAACHGPDGKGTSVAPNIIGMPKARIERAIDGGVPQMSIIELDDTQLEAVFRYLQTLP